MPLKVKVKFLGDLQARAGLAETELKIGGPGVRDLIDKLKERFGKDFGEIFVDQNYLLIVDGVLIDPVTVSSINIKENAIVVMLPSVGGGA